MVGAEPAAGDIIVFKFVNRIMGSDGYIQNLKIGYEKRPVITEQQSVHILPFKPAVQKTDSGTVVVLAFHADGTTDRNLVDRIGRPVVRSEKEKHFQPDFIIFRITFQGTIGDVKRINALFLTGLFKRVDYGTFTA